MKTAYSRFTLVLTTVAALLGCAPQPRYELQRTEKGAVRLDKTTGEMIALDEKLRVVAVDTGAAREKLEVDQALMAPKDFAAIDCSTLARGVSLRVRMRWMRGRIEVQIVFTPYTAALLELNSVTDISGADIFIITLTDSDGFELARFQPIMSLATQITGSPDVLLISDSTELAKADFTRLAKITPSWRVSPRLQKALNP